MILKEMIDTLRMPQRMQIRDEEGWEICTCNTNSEGVLPYMNWYVTEWFANYHLPSGNADFVVYAKEKKEVRELIRCKDCKYYVKKYGVCNARITIILNEKDDDFCSLAERKEDYGKETD